MHPLVFFNRKIYSPEQINLSALSSAALYGRGIFTTLAVYQRKPFLWEKHWRRLTANAARIRLDLSEFSEADIKLALSETIGQNQIENARARITFYDETAGRIWPSAVEGGTSVLITVADPRPPKNLRLSVSTYRINSASPLAGVKSCNYLEQILALEEAQAGDADEAVRLNERGAAAAACMANLFWIKNGKIYTSPVETGCLAGTTRELLLETQAIEEKIINLDELSEADEIFLTSSGLGIGKVASFDRKILENTLTSDIEREFSRLKT
jgi:branched-subunit amino acid aminotransferase/4-amino-4-deoxychorismate lyase